MPRCCVDGVSESSAIGSLFLLVPLPRTSRRPARVPCLLVLYLPRRNTHTPTCPPTHKHTRSYGQGVRNGAEPRRGAYDARDPPTYAASVSTGCERCRVPQPSHETRARTTERGPLVCVLFIGLEYVSNLARSHSRALCPWCLCMFPLPTLDGL